MFTLPLPAPEVISLLLHGVAATMLEDEIAPADVIARRYRELDDRATWMEAPNPLRVAILEPWLILFSDKRSAE